VDNGSHLWPVTDESVVLDTETEMTGSWFISI
jgi:hypothetical protein